MKHGVITGHCELMKGMEQSGYVIFSLFCSAEMEYILRVSLLPFGDP